MAKKVYTVTGFDGHWPVGTSAVIVADNMKHATTMLEEELTKRGLKIGDSCKIVRLPLTTDSVHILQDGDY
jgi:hypothetical protein